MSNSTLTSRVKAARRAIGDDGARQRLIATLHGVGYRFVGDVTEPAVDPVVGASAPLEEGAPEGRSQEIRYCRSEDGVEIAYATSGAGPPLVKAANWLTNLDLEWESPVWPHWIQFFSVDTACSATTSVAAGCPTGTWSPLASALGGRPRAVVDAAGSSASR